MTTKEWKQEILARLDNMTDDELIEVYLNSLKADLNINTNSTIANLIARVNQLEWKMQTQPMQSPNTAEPYDTMIKTTC